jgi:hypothetical protein
VSRAAHAGGGLHPRNPPGRRWVYPLLHQRAGRSPLQLPQRWVPDLIERLSTDAWMSLNTFWRAGTAKQDDLRYLNACFVDCDYYKQGSVGFPEAVGSVLRAKEGGILPPATLLINSGRGLWVIYLLAATSKSREPPRSWPESIALYRRIQVELRRRFQRHLPELGADANASDPSRLARVPGSLNTRSGRKVEYLFLADREGGFTYTLDELASQLEIPASISIESRGRPANPKPGRRRGWISLLQARLADLKTLRQLRRGIPEGTRDFHLYFTAMLLRKLGAGDSQVRAELLDLWKECHQRPQARNRYTWNEALGKVEASRMWKRFTNMELLARLAISPSELEHLRSIRPKARTEPEAKRGNRQAERRAKILDLIESRFNSEVPSSRRMALALLDHGIPVSHTIVVRDYSALDLSPRRVMRSSARPGAVPPPPAPA